VTGVVQTAPATGRRRRRLTASTDDGGAVKIEFNVAGLKSASSANAVVAGIVQVATAGDSATGASPASSGQPTDTGLLGALAVAVGKDLAVSQAQAPLINATVTIEVVVPPDVDSTTLANDMAATSDSGAIADGMNQRGVTAGGLIELDRVESTTSAPAQSLRVSIHPQRTKSCSDLGFNNPTSSPTRERGD